MGCLIRYGDRRVVFLIIYNILFCIVLHDRLAGCLCDMDYFMNICKHKGY